jgi:hypothetical protein
MTEANLNPTVDGYRGSIGRLVFKRYKGKTIVARKPVRTKEPGPEELARREHFQEGVAYAKSIMADPAARAFYEPIAVQRDRSVYMVALRDFLKKPTIKPLDLSGYSGQVDDVIVIRATDDIGLANLHVKIASSQGTLIEHGAAIESAVVGKWMYTCTTSVPLGSEVSIEVVGIDHAHNSAKLVESLTVGEDG